MAQINRKTVNVGVVDSNLYIGLVLGEEKRHGQSGK